MLLFVDLVRGCVFGGGETRGSVRVGVALCDLWGTVSATSRGNRSKRLKLTLVTLLGSSRHGTLDRLGGLVDSVPGNQADQ